MPLSHGEIDILFSASEDSLPLWEAKWEAVPDIADVSVAERISGGQEAIRNLLALGFIEIYYSSSWVGGQETLLASEEWDHAIANVNHWRCSEEVGERSGHEDQGFYCLYITDKGKDYYIHSEEVISYHETKWYSAHSRRTA